MLEYEFNDLVDISKVQKLIKMFYAATGLTASILDVKNNILVASSWQKICSHFHRNNQETRERCLWSDSYISRNLKSGQRHVIYKCENGLIDVASPIIVDGQHLANVFMGQFVHEKPDREYFKEKAKRFGFNEAAYLKALGEVPIVTKEKVEPYINYLTELAETLADMGLKQLKVIQAEEHLRESETRYRQLVELSPYAIIVHTNGKIVFANIAACQLLGERLWKIIGKPIYCFISKDEAIGRTTVETVKKKKRADVYEGELIRSDGRVIFIEVTETPYVYEGEEAIRSEIRDITERKKIDQELIKIDKLESLGLLAGGIAHDYNNILTIILGSASLAKMHAKNEDKLFDKLIKIEKAALQAKDLTKQLQTFSRGGNPLKEIVPIDKLLKEVTKLSLSGSKVQAQFLISDNLYYGNVDKGQISQVINNLIINAVQAMPQGGTIYVKAKNIVNDEVTGTPFLREKNYIKICIEDEGTGILKRNLSKIFDPFFTTKQGGTGLGLATCYSIIKKHKGYITVDSIRGKGTVFYFYLPASIGKEIRRTKNTESIQKGTGNILVMDDKNSVLNVVGDMLSFLGYTATFATEGEKAITAYKAAKEKGEPFTAVILDLTIPGGMGGRETVKELLKVDPGAKVIVSSGYSEVHVISEFNYYGFKDMITKPYKLKELSDVIYRVIYEN